MVLVLITFEHICLFVYLFTPLTMLSPSKTHLFALYLAGESVEVSATAEAEALAHAGLGVVVPEALFSVFLLFYDGYA